MNCPKSQKSGRAHATAQVWSEIQALSNDYPIFGDLRDK